MTEEAEWGLTAWPIKERRFLIPFGLILIPRRYDGNVALLQRVSLDHLFPDVLQMVLTKPGTSSPVLLLTGTTFFWLLQPVWLPSWEAAILKSRAFGPLERASRHFKRSSPVVVSSAEPEEPGVGSVMISVQ